MHRAAPLAHLGALLASCCVDTLAQQQRELLHSPQLQALSERRALQAAYVMDDAAIAEASPVPRSDFGQKVIFWAFYCRSSNFAALVRPLRARARAGDRPGHITG